MLNQEVICKLEKLVVVFKVNRGEVYIVIGAIYPGVLIKSEHSPF